MSRLKYFYIVLSIVIFATLIGFINIVNYPGGNAINTETVNLSRKSVEANNTTVPSAYSHNNSSRRERFTVVVDAGHGSVDSGSVGPRGTLEKDMTLSIALKLGRILESHDVNVVYTRKIDNFAWAGQKEDLLSRAELANNSSADLFISLHMNSSEYKDVRGTETYYHPTSSKGKKLAAIVQKQLVNEVELRDRGIKSEDFSVLRNVTAPAILIELGYISSYAEEVILRDISYHNKFAKAIADGIFKFINP